MKKITALFAILLLLFACKKEDYDYDREMIASENCLTNYYVLTSISQKVLKKTNYIYATLNEEDTCQYSEFYIILDLNGYLVEEDPRLTDNPSFYIHYYERKYFVNRIKDVRVSMSQNYNEDIFPDYILKIYRKNINIVSFLSYRHIEFGYSPISLFLLDPPDTTKLMSFFIEIEDDFGNIFTTTTTPIYITN